MIAGQPHFSTRRAQRVSICVVIALLLAGNSAALRSEQINEDRIQILKVISQVRDAGISRDVAMIEKLHANDYFHTNADGSVMTKAEMVASYKIPSQTIIESSEHHEDTVLVHGDVAVVSGTVTLKGHDKESFVRSWRITYVLRKNHGQWRIIVSHASLLSQ